MPKAIRLHCSCLLCKTQVTTNNLNQHYQSKQCKQGTKFSLSHSKIEVSSNLKCIFCNKLTKNDNSYRQHFTRCQLNPNKKRVVSSFPIRNKNIVPWNKGKTKETDYRIAQQAKLASETMQEKHKNGLLGGAFTKEYWTSEKRKEKSEWRKKLHENNPETHPNRRLAGNRKNMSYPEKVAYDYLCELGIKFEHNKKVDRFYPDFVIDDIIIEIDGKYYHDHDYDKERDKILESKGYQVFRIDSQDKIQERIKNILRIV